MNRKLIGSHINSDIITLVDEVKKIYKYGGGLVQIFTSPVDNLNIYDNFINIIKKLKITVIIHAPYAFNIAKELDIYSWQIKYLLQQAQLMQLFKSRYIVLHLGKKLNLPIREAIQNMYNNILYLINNTSNVQFLIETSSGQGSELLYDIYDFANFYNNLIKKIKKNRIGICLDICHIYQAGWDIRSIEKFNNLMKLFDKIIGINNIKLIHFNNSLYDFNSRKDRHANIETGYIDKTVLYYIAKYFINKNIPLVLETPFDKTELLLLQNI